MILTLVVTLWLSGLIELRLLKATRLDTNTKAVLAKFVRAVLLVVGVLVALQAIGFDLTLLTVFGGALGVGIGLGLQKLACQLHRRLHDPARPLDPPGRHHHRRRPPRRRVARHVALCRRDAACDGVEAIVPNETLVTTTVLNHSLLDAGSPDRHRRSRSPTTATSTSRSS